MNITIIVYDGDIFSELEKIFKDNKIDLQIKLGNTVLFGQVGIDIVEVKEE